MKAIALYDVDYTIISTNSLKDFFIYCFKKNPLKIIYIPFLALCFLLWVFKALSFEKLKSFFLIIIKGMTKEKLDAFSSKFIKSEIIPRIKPEALKSIKDNRKAGRLIVFASASFEFYIKFLAEYLKADFYFGTKAVFAGNKIKAEIDGVNCKGNEKIRRISEKIKLNDIDKKRSIGFTDCVSDMPYLKITDELVFVDKKKWLIKNSIKK